MKRAKNYFLRFMRAIIGTFQGFIDDDCYLNASALSFFTLLAIVPVLAVAFGVAKGFGFEQILEKLILENFYQQPQFAEKMIDFAHSTLDQAKGGLIGGIGVIALFWTSFGVLGNFESSLNKIWKIPQMRPWARRIPDYLAVLVLCPIFLTITGSLTFFILTKIVDITAGKGIYNELRPLIYSAYYFLLFALSWAIFSFIFFFVPNKKIPWSACIAAGIFSGTLFQLIQWGYIKFQIYVTSYNAIYGSFAAIPLFLIWLQLSWLITLLGGELSCHFARSKYAYGKPADQIEISERELALLICLQCAASTSRGIFPISMEKLSEVLKLPLLPLQDTAEKLLYEKILYKIRSEDEQVLFQPAQSLEQITLQSIDAALRRTEERYWSVASSPSLLNVKKYWSDYYKSENETASNLSLQQMLNMR